MCTCVYACVRVCNNIIQVGDLTTSSQLILNMSYSNKRTKFKVTSYDGHETVQVFRNTCELNVDLLNYTIRRQNKHRV